MQSEGNLLDRQVILSHLEWALQALALPTGDQAALFPDSAHPVDELILDFDHWYLVSLSDLEDVFSPAQQSALEALDRRLDEAAKGSTDGEMLNTPEWETVRSCARQALDAFGWRLALPPSDRRAFVPSVQRKKTRKTR
jgi:hypothetical protein